MSAEMPRGPEGRALKVPVGVWLALCATQGTLAGLQTKEDCDLVGALKEPLCVKTILKGDKDRVWETIGRRLLDSSRQEMMVVTVRVVGYN